MGTPKWEEHENKCYDYLNNKFGNDATFIPHGGSDSTIADIEVKLKNGDSFWIECKSPLSQCGQFVVMSQEDKFVFSSGNHSESNKYTKKIIDIMNDDFDKYLNAGTSGVVMDIDVETSSNCIKAIYVQKKVKYFITCTNEGKFVISPIESFSDFYSITAKYRVKKSGSRKVGKTYQKLLSEEIMNANIFEEPSFEYGKKMCVKSSVFTGKEKMEINGERYKFAKINDDSYEVRRLSDTNNANVIFEISLKNENGLSESEFRKILLG